MKFMSFPKRVIAFTLALIMLALCVACDTGETDNTDIIDSIYAEPKNEIAVTAKVSSGAKYDSTKLYALEALDTSSPDGNITMHFWQDENGGLYYSVTFGMEKVITPSKLGIVLSSCNLSTGFDSITSYDRAELINEEYETAETISLENVSRLDYCLEQTAYFTKGDAGFILKIRVYNDGFAYRFEDVTSGKSGNVYVTKEVSEINLKEGTTLFGGGYSATYENGYDEFDYEQFKSAEQVFNTPLTAYTGNVWMLFSESDVYANDITYIKSVLETNSGSTTLNWAFGFERDPANEVDNDYASPGHIRIIEVVTTDGFTTPWRATILADNLNDLVNSDLINALCPAADEELYADTSWIKPGKVAWSWWSGENQESYDAQIEFIDFAAEYGWEYCCIDLGWKAFENRLEEIVDYANSKGVGIIVWVNYRELTTVEEIEEQFSRWSEAGVVGVKTDYFESDAISGLEAMRNCAEIGAKYQLMIYYHGCICPCGETRTYPNIMTSEAVMGEEFRKWSEVPDAENCLMYPFTRNVVGSMDYTPSCIAISKTGESGGYSLAKAIVYESTLQHFAASAKLFPSYVGLSLLNKIPTVWQSSTLLDGYPGKYITYLRTDGEDYYIGSMTATARSISIDLDFLGDGEYNAYIYRDDENGQLILEVKTVTVSDTLAFDLMDLGGVAVMITKDTVDTSVKESPFADAEGYTYYECEDGILTGSAVVSGSMLCSGEQKVGYVGAISNACELTVSVPTDGEYEIIVYYCTGETRDMLVYVNGDKYTLTGLSGTSFDIPLQYSFTAHLKAGENSLKLTSVSGWAPDLDRIAVSDETIN